jgi:hypothetical protein
MYLIDTNVISERRKGNRADPGVKRFIDDNANELFVPVLALGEILAGIERLRLRGDLDQARLVDAWYETIMAEFSDRVLAFDASCAELWGKLMGMNDQHIVDKQIAAIGLAYNLTIVTRNVRHYEKTGVRLLNPFMADQASETPAN